MVVSTHLLHPQTMVFLHTANHNLEPTLEQATPSLLDLTKASLECILHNQVKGTHHQCHR